MKKRLAAVLLTAVMTLTVAGCGSAAEMSAATRVSGNDDGIVYIDEAAVALAGSVRNDQMSADEQQRADELRNMAKETLDLVNQERANAGLPALAWDDSLEICAMVRATEVTTTWSHNRPDGSEYWTVNSELMWGENLAKGQKTAAEVVSQWMGSPLHKENLLGDFTTCGIAIYETGGKLYFAQEFGY